ncbi:MAG: tetratricopeptide repeat protein [Anaeromyxobacter sp.]
MVRHGAGDDGLGLDDAIEQHLRRGAERLARGDVDGAAEALEQARALRPDDVQVMGLAGQVAYRRGDWAVAVEAWQTLVDANPGEPAARVNLGLALLRGRRHAEAVRQLEVALELAPDHRRAMNYLGLALLECNDPRRARTWFVRAGSDQMVARCDERLGLPNLRRRPAPDDAAAEARPEPMPGPGRPGEEVAFAELPLAGSPAPTASLDVCDGLLVVRAGARVRLSGWVATEGPLLPVPEVRWSAGLPTEVPFGGGADQLHRLQGEGLLRVAPGPGSRFTLTALVGEPAWLREAAVAALDGQVAFENGLLPGVGGVEVVEVRGPGAAVIRSRGAPVVLAVSPGAPVQVQARALLAWSGALAARGLPSPALREAQGEREEEWPPAVELSGEGRVVIDPGAPGAPDGGGA